MSNERGLLILGVDPGSRRTGWAAVEKRGRALGAVASGVLRPPAAGDLAARLGWLLAELESLLERLAPAQVAVEDVFAAHNARSALALGQARGVVLAAAGRRALPVFAYPPATVKRAVCGHGRAEKQQIQRMVEVLLALPRSPAEDEADAMAIAICHALSSHSRALVPRARRAGWRAQRGAS
jgi:crossover junction endodeoxyribonuclease RuvC